MDQISELLSVIRLLVITMAVITVIMGFVRYGVAFFKQVIWLGIIVGFIMFVIIPNL